MKSLLITGGTGTLGHGLTEKLLKTNIERLCILSRSEKDQYVMRQKFPDSRLRFFIGDVRDKWRVLKAMEGCDAVIHAAALKRIEVGVYNPMEMVLTNCIGSHNVTEAARYAGVKKCILVSTDKACDPVSPYGDSKALAESIFLAADASAHPGHTRYSGVRYGNVWCSAGSVVPLWSAILKSGGMPIVTDSACTRFFMLVSEAVDFVLAALESMKGGEVLTPELPAYRLGDLYEAMVGHQPKEQIGLPAHEKLHESMVRGKTSEEARRMTLEELKEHLKCGTPITLKTSEQSLSGVSVNTLEPHTVSQQRAASRLWRLVVDILKSRK